MGASSIIQGEKNLSLVAVSNDGSLEKIRTTDGLTTASVEIGSPYTAGFEVPLTWKRPGQEPLVAFKSYAGDGTNVPLIVDFEEGRVTRLEPNVLGGFNTSNILEIDGQIGWHTLHANALKTALRRRHNHFAVRISRRLRLGERPPAEQHTDFPWNRIRSSSLQHIRRPAVAARSGHSHQHRSGCLR